jgi:hypothetical protein
MASLLLLGVLMLPAALGMLGLGIRTAEPSASKEGPTMFEGMYVLWRNVPLRATAVATGMGSIGAGVLPIAATLLSQERLTVDAGLMLSTMAVGALMGSLLYAAKPVGSGTPQWLVAIGTLMSVVPMTLLLATGSDAIALGLFAIGGMIRGPLGAAQFAVRERFSPEDVRTQVFTLSAGIKTTCAALGAALAGMFEHAGSASLIGVVVASNALAGILALVILKGKRASPQWRPADVG